MVAETVTDEQAQEVLDAIVAHYKMYFEPITSDATGRIIVPPAAKPTVQRDERGHAVIWWEDGPSDWAYQVTGGGSTEEERVLFAEAGQEFGAELKAAEPEPMQFPPHVYVEPHTSYAVGVYPA
jgi:hypothetical protein